MESDFKWTPAVQWNINKTLPASLQNWLFSSVATAKFSKFAGILSAALSQHHLLGFEIVQLEFHHLHMFIVILPKAHLTALQDVWL